MTTGRAAALAALTVAALLVRPGDRPAVRPQGPPLPPPTVGPSDGGGAERAATRFGEVWWADDGPARAPARRRRLLQMVTPALASQLGAIQPVPVLDQATDEEGRRVAVDRVSVTVEDRSARGTALAVTAVVTATRAHGSPVRALRAAELLAVPVGRTWLVAGLQQ